MTDAERTKFLESRGYKVLRFWNTDIMEHTDSVAEIIFIEAQSRLQNHPHP